MGSYWQETEVRFESDEQLKRHIDRLLEPLGMRIDAEHASISAILRDGSQLEAILPPLSSDGPMVTIKRPRPPVCRKLCELSGPPSVPLLSQNVVDMLTACVRGKVNIIVSGACDSNKAEVLNALCQELTFQAFKFAHPRIIAIEREQILSLPKGHIIRLKSSGHNQFVLLKKALAMMPDRVVLDECTGDEVYDLLNLMASPLKGAMTTINANSARDCLYRLENMVLLSHAALPQQNVRYLIAEAHPLIIHVRRFEDGVHRIAEIVELQGINDDQWHSRTLIDQLKDDVPRDNDYIIAPLFQIECRGRDRRGFFKCRLKSTSNTPLFVEQLSNEAIPFEHNWLKSEDDVARAID